ncbi:MAG: hypothetical protein AAGC71_05090 [Pseudomonadota bacterium]
MVNAWRTVSIGVADFDAVKRLWLEQMAFELLAERHGADAHLGALWNIPPEMIAHQWLIGCAGIDAGRMHLVQFASDVPAVRDGAAAFDLCPKNLDIYVDDIAARVTDLKAAGFQFRTESYSDVHAPDGTEFREIHLPSHDSINVVLLEVVGKSLPFTNAGFAGVGPLVVTVADASAEAAFYESLGFSPLAHNVLSGPVIEQMIGLPAGASLDITMLGDEAQPFGEMEIIQYGGTNGRDLYPATQPPARGIVDIHLHADDPAALAATLDCPVETCSVGETLLAAGPAYRLRSPAGMAVTLWPTH